MKGSSKFKRQRATLSSEMANRSLSLAQLYLTSKQSKTDYFGSQNIHKYSVQAHSVKTPTLSSNIFEEKKQQKIENSFSLSSDNYSEESILSVHFVEKYNNQDEDSDVEEQKLDQDYEQNFFLQNKQRKYTFTDRLNKENLKNSQIQNQGEIQLQKFEKQHQKLIKKNPLQDAYYVLLQPISGLQKLLYEYQNYHDQGRFLVFRKRVVFIFYFFPTIIQALINSVIFKLFMTTLILFNVGLFIYVKTNNRTDTDHIEQIITILFLIEISFRIIASGVILNSNSFFRSPLNVYDFSLIVLTTLNLYRPDIIKTDISPLRMITLLNYLGDILKGLSVMLKALKSSLKFLIEALIIVGLFSLFFGILGVFLFQGLFNYRCQYENGDETDGWVQCDSNSCPEGMKCLHSQFTPKPPTSFNNIIYSLGQILRTITMDDWSWVMFFTMRIYNTWIWIYYLLIIFVGGFFGFNLVIAVLKTHYAEIAEETIQEERKQQIAIRLREKQENPERDLISIFDVAVLKHIGIYKAYQSYKKQLNSAFYQSQSNKIQNLNDDFTKQPKVRTLSGRQNIKDKGNNVTFQDRLDQFNLKYLLLPRFKYLDEKKDKILPSNYSDDPLELELLQRLLTYSFSSLSPYPNYTIVQNYSSQEDILLSFIERQTERKMYDQLQMIMKCRKTKFQLSYSLTKKKYKKTNTHKQKTMMPLKFSKLKLKSSMLDPTVEEEITKPNILLDKKADNFKQNPPIKLVSRVSTPNLYPFSIMSKKRIFLRIQDQYIDFEAITEKIKTKIPKMIDNTTSNEFKYGLLRQKELRLKHINKKNWSGNEVLQLNFTRQQQFNEIKASLNNQDHNIWLVGIKGKFKSIQKYCYIVISSKFSIFFFDLVILFNFTFLSLQGIVDPILISNIEDISTIFLCVELTIFLLSYSIKEIIRTHNILYIIIIFINFIELVFGDDIGSSTDQSLRLLRGTKCLLFYRCLKYNKMANKIGKIANKTFESYIYLTFLMFLVIFMYALIGMEMYAGEFDQNDTLGQLHSFDNIFKSFMTVFNIMTNDDWYGVYVMGGYLDYTFAVIYSYSMVIVLNYLTYGLVLAILLDGFGKYLGEEEETIAQDENQQMLQTINSEMHECEFDQTHQTDFINISKNKVNLIQNLLLQIKQIYIQMQEKNKSVYNEIECQQSLYLFDKKNVFRIITTKIVLNQLYKYFIDLTIYFSVVIFIIKTYHDYEKDSSDLPDQLLLISNIIILFDFCINIIAKGFFLDQGAFLQSIWQIIDIIYIISFCIYYLSKKKDYAPIIDVLIFLGYFRPMKLMYRINQLTQLRAALGLALFDIINVLISLLSVWLVFGVYGIILYEQQFGYCEDKMEFYISKKECNNENKTWVTYKHNFDNITAAIPTLFVVSTFDGWGEILQVAENSQTSDIGPMPFNGYLYTYIYLIIFCFIGSMFFLSLFTGVLYTSLKENQLKMENEDLTQNQKEFIKITDMLMFDFPIFSEPPKTKFRQIASKIVNNSKIQICIYILLIIDLIILLLINSEMSKEYFNIVNNIHNALTLIYLIWIILLFLALGVNRYFDNYWRRFYVFLIVISIVDLTTHYTLSWTEIYFHSSPNNQYYQILRLFFSLRSLRILLIFQGLINIQRLIRVMAFAVPYLVKIFTILIITMVIFALFGCHLYGKIDSGAVMDDLINFQSFGNAMLALYKCASGDDWRTIMTDTMQHNPLCQDDPKYCGSSASQIYFILFMLLSNYVLLNLFVLGLIEQFEQFFQMQNSQIQIYVENVDKIKTIWCKYSSEQQGKGMHYKYLCKFLLDIGLPLGLDNDCNLWDACKFTSNFKLQSDVYGYIQYNFLMYELFRKCFYDSVFKQGSEESIKKIKQFHKKSQFRLIYFRKDKNLPRSNISSTMIAKPNVNILHDYINVLILFKTWEQFSKTLIDQVNEEEQFSDSSFHPAIVSQMNQNQACSYQQSQIHILHENETDTFKDNDSESQIEEREHRISLNSQDVNQYNDLPFYKGTYETSLQSENRDFTFLRAEKQFESEI